MMKSLRLLSVMTALLLTLFSSAQRKYELTVREAVDLAYKNVMDLRNAEVDYRIQEAMNNELTGKALPTVTGFSGIQHYMMVPKFPIAQSAEGIYQVLKYEQLIPQSTPVPPPTLGHVSFQQPYNLTAGGNLTQLLFQPDVFVGLQARKTALALSQSLIDQTKDKIKDSAARKYYAILVVEKQLHFLNESIRRLEKLYHDDSIMFVNGFAEKLDLDKVQVQMNNIKYTRNVVETALAMSHAALKYSLGVSQADTIVLKDELTLDIVKSGILDESFKYEDRAEIRTLNRTRDLQLMDVKRNKLSVLPTVSVGANYTITGFGKQFWTSETDWIKSSYIGMNINLPVFDGFQRKYRTQQSELKVEKIDNTITGFKQVIDLQQVVSKQNLITAINNLDLQERNVALALKVYNITKIKFEQGLGSSFEVLQADTEYQTAQANFFTALYTATIARIAYLSSLGKLE